MYKYIIFNKKNNKKNESYFIYFNIISIKKNISNSNIFAI